MHAPNPQPERQPRHVSDEAARVLRDLEQKMSSLRQRSNLKPFQSHMIPRDLLEEFYELIDVQEEAENGGASAQGALNVARTRTWAWVVKHFPSVYGYDFGVNLKDCYNVFIEVWSDKYQDPLIPNRPVDVLHTFTPEQFDELAPFLENEYVSKGYKLALWEKIDAMLPHLDIYKQVIGNAKLSLVNPPLQIVRYREPSTDGQATDKE